MVVSARNPVHSVLFLILAFFNSAGLFVLIGAEFLAMILVVVYVGAVAVLFMFVVMMLDINFVRLREGFLRYLPIGLADRLRAAGRAGAGRRHLGRRAARRRRTARAAGAAAGGDATSQALGNLLYTDYFYLFQTAGMILLVAIIGAITLTLRHRPACAARTSARQVNRPRGRDRRAAQGAHRERRSDGDRRSRTT